MIDEQEIRDIIKELRSDIRELSDIKTGHETHPRVNESFEDWIERLSNIYEPVKGPKFVVTKDNLDEALTMLRIVMDEDKK